MLLIVLLPFETLSQTCVLLPALECDEQQPLTGADVDVRGKSRLVVQRLGFEGKRGKRVIKESDKIKIKKGKAWRKEIFEGRIRAELSVAPGSIEFVYWRN